MSQLVHIVCDRCGTVSEGTVDNGAGPHWSLQVSSMDRRVGNDFAFDVVSWDLCEPCAQQVAEVLTSRAGLPKPRTSEAATLERLGLSA